MSARYDTKTIPGFLALAWLSFGCAPDQPTQRPRVDQPTSAKATQDPLPLQFVYGERIPPDKLSIAQEKEIRDAVRLAGKIEEVWFVYVRQNRKGDFFADVYFRPVAGERRVSRGRCVTIGRSSLVVAIAEAIGQPPATQPSASEPEDYVYVRLAGSKQDLKFAPTGNAMPFAAEGEFTDLELEEIADFYRSSNQASLPVYSPNRFNHRLPIMKVRRIEKDIEITTGIQEAMLSGRGEILLLRRTSEGFELIQLSQWVS